MSHIPIDQIEAREVDWLTEAVITVLRIALSGGGWWLWTWAFKIEAPSWSFWFAAFLGMMLPLSRIQWVKK